MKESDIHRAIMLSLSPRSILFRNNVGSYQKPDGSWLTYGVQNPGGSDLLGWTKIVITPEMVGHTLAVFTAIEVKQPSKRTKATDPQLQFLHAVNMAGGISGLATSPEEAMSLLLTYSQQYPTVNTSDKQKGVLNEPDSERPA